MKFGAAKSHLKIAFVASLTTAHAVSCADAEGELESLRKGADPALEAVEVTSAVTTTSDGTIEATFQSANPNTQIIKAPDGTAIAGSELRIPPGSFDVDFGIKLDEGTPLDSQKNLLALGYDATTIAQTSGPGVFLHWGYDEDSYRPLTLRIPAPPAAALRANGANLTVLFLKNVANSEENRLGAVPASKLKSEGGFVEFETQSSGIFQAVLLSAVVKETVPEVKTTEQQTKVVTNPAVPPAAFAITGPTKVLNGAALTVTWDRSVGATAYDLKIDAKDATCAAPYKTVADVKVRYAKLEGLQTGTNHVCLVAKNKAGTTAASNSGTFAVKVDGTSPPVPGKPAFERTSSNIEVKCVWTGEMTDEGEAGFGHFLVEIGTTKGGADFFNGPVADGTSKAKPGFIGTTYYCRVRAVDQVGNASTPVESDPFTL